MRVSESHNEEILYWAIHHGILESSSLKDIPSVTGCRITTNLFWYLIVVPGRWCWHPFLFLNLPWKLEPLRGFRILSYKLSINQSKEAHSENIWGLLGFLSFSQLPQTSSKTSKWLSLSYQCKVLRKINGSEKSVVLKPIFVTRFVLFLLFSTHHFASNILTTSHLQSLQKIIVSNILLIQQTP